MSSQTSCGWPLLPLLLLFAQSLHAESEAQLDAIRTLGGLNGVALQCGALAQTQRMKRTLVATLPKKRQLGELFDYETNRAFMDFMAQRGSCPGAEDLKQQVDAALQALQAVYANDGSEAR